MDYMVFMIMGGFFLLFIVYIGNTMSKRMKEVVAEHEAQNRDENYRDENDKFRNFIPSDGDIVPTMKSSLLEERDQVSNYYVGIEDYENSEDSISPITTLADSRITIDQNEYKNFDAKRAFIYSEIFRPKFND